MSDKVNYYQSIPELGIEGRQKTHEEFENIGLPKSLNGKSVLDVGCNIGAFLLECYNRGADRLIGVEIDDDWRWIANGLMREFVVGGSFGHVVRDLPSISYGKFDLVLILSLLHLIENPQEVLDMAWDRVEKGGLLIVEINDRLQDKVVTLPKSRKESFYGKNKDNRSVYHFVKDNS